MEYNEVGWKNYPDKTTKMSAENLGHMDQGIKTNSDNIGDMSKLEVLDDGTLAGEVARLQEENKLLKEANSKLNSELTPIDISDQFTVANSGSNVVAHRIGNRIEGVVTIPSGTSVSNAYADLFESMPKNDIDYVYGLSIITNNKNDVGKIDVRFRENSIQYFASSSFSTGATSRVMFFYYLAE